MTREQKQRYEGIQMIADAEWNYGIMRAISLDDLNRIRSIGSALISKSASVSTCDCGNTISMGPQGWVHEDSDQRSCERANPAASEI